jgi:hypothetical protein
MLAGTVAPAGDTWIEDKVDPSTTRLAVALIEPDWTLMVAAPADWPVAVPEAETVATLVSDEEKATVPFIDRWLPSLKVPSAL